MKRPSVHYASHITFTYKLILNFLNLRVSKPEA